MPAISKKVLKGGVSPYIIALVSHENIDKASISDEGLTDKEFSPTSGSEPKYEPHKWHRHSKIKETHNCYSYALNAIVSSRLDKPQPGYTVKFPHISNGNYTCDPFVKRLQKIYHHYIVLHLEVDVKKDFIKYIWRLQQEKELIITFIDKIQMVIGVINQEELM